MVLLVLALALGFVNTGIGCFLYFSSLSMLPVQTVAVCGYLEPLSAVLFAALLLGEKMTALQITGGICIIDGAMIGELMKDSKVSSHQPDGMEMKRETIKEDCL